MDWFNRRKKDKEEIEFLKKFINDYYNPPKVLDSLPQDKGLIKALRQKIEEQEKEIEELKRSLSDIRIEEVKKICNIGDKFKYMGKDMTIISFNEYDICIGVICEYYDGVSFKTKEFSPELLKTLI